MKSMWRNGILSCCCTAMECMRIVDDDHLPWLHGQDLQAVFMRLNHGHDLGFRQ